MNNNIIKLIFATLFSSTLIGCSTSAIKSGSYEGLKNSDPSKGTIYVYRESSFAGAANQYDVLIDGVLVGSLPNGTFFNVNTAPGEKNIKADTGSFGKGSNIYVDNAKAYCLKMTLNFCVGCKSADITPVDNEQCNSEIKSLTQSRLK